MTDESMVPRPHVLDQGPVVSLARGVFVISKKVQARVRKVLKEGATLAYWNSDAQGRPANHKPEHPELWTAREGLVQTVEGPLAMCGPHALHATLTPHKWAGCRVWLVALWGEIQKSEDKMGALKREILCEVFPEDAIDPSVGVRIGVKDLSGANLRSANLGSANLGSAYLRGANLYGANLVGAVDLTLPEGWVTKNGIAVHK